VSVGVRGDAGLFAGAVTWDKRAALEGMTLRRNVKAGELLFRADLEHEASHQVDRDMRAELLKQLAARVRFDVPSSLLDREIDRRVEEFVRRLMEQQIDPMKTNINWEEFRERQKDAAAEAVRGALVLDEVARREQLSATEAESRLRSGATPSGPAGLPPPCGRGWRRRGASDASTPGCGGRKRWISCCRKRQFCRYSNRGCSRGTIIERPTTAPPVDTLPQHTDFEPVPGPAFYV